MSTHYIPGIFSNWYGRAKPKDVTLHVDFEKDYIKCIIQTKPLKLCLWIHKKTLFDCAEKEQIVKALEYFERKG